MTARLTHDFADREATLEVQVGSAAAQPIVAASTYQPSGPLAGLTLGNGLAESRGYTSRYLPLSLQVPGRLDQTYTTDAVGNILGIERQVGTVHWPSGFTYQDPQYFLTQGTGPWGHQEWTYDRIGNRLSEGAPDADELFTYSYVPNAAGSNTPKLAAIAPAPGSEPGSRLDFGFDAAGNQTAAAAVSAEGSPGRTSLLAYSEESRLSRLGTSDSPTASELLYDGRGFLRRASQTTPGTTDFTEAEPLYSSEGLLLARRARSQTTHGGGGDEEPPPVTDLADETTYLFYFAGRPVAQLKRLQTGGGVDELLYLTVDHLGTPILATDELGQTAWEGGLDPFGTPYAFPETPPPDDEPPCTGDDCAAAATLAAAAATAESAGIFLRFPGQWDDPSFGSSGLHGGLYYNVYRWYQPGAGRYSQTEPIQYLENTSHFLYVFNSPLTLVDPRGLEPGLPPGAQPCLLLGDVDPTKDCCESPVLGSRIQAANRLKAFFCANKDKPAAEFKPQPGRQIVQIGGHDPYAWYVPQGNKCVDRCLCAHEELHIWQLSSSPRFGWTANALECESYDAELRCLLGAKHLSRPLDQPFIPALPIF